MRAEELAALEPQAERRYLLDAEFHARVKMGAQVLHMTTGMTMAACIERAALMLEAIDRGLEEARNYSPSRALIQAVEAADVSGALRRGLEGLR